MKPTSRHNDGALALAHADLHVKPYAKRHVKAYSDTRAPRCGRCGLNPSYKPREGTDGELHHLG
jgi:hypothetical protein